MDFSGIQVKHISFGTGKVLALDNQHIEIQFDSSTKRFSFPDVFVSFLKTEDVEFSDFIQQALLIKEKTSLVKQEAQRAEQTSERRSQATNNSSSFYQNIDSFSPLLGERAQTIDFRNSHDLFEAIGYLAYPGRILSFEAEVPIDGRDEAFERLFPGQTYRPITVNNTPSGLPSKMGPQFRINMASIKNCPEVLQRNTGSGNGNCVARINRSKFVISLVERYGFRFGSTQNTEEIRHIAEDQGFLEDFEKGYNR
jgi:hypothetical protein